jgi:hypothetical protein
MKVTSGAKIASTDHPETPNEVFPTTSERTPFVVSASVAYTLIAASTWPDATAYIASVDPGATSGTDATTEIGTRPWTASPIPLPTSLHPGPPLSWKSAAPSEATFIANTATRPPGSAAPVEDLTVKNWAATMRRLASPDPVLVRVQHTA